MVVPVIVVGWTICFKRSAGEDPQRGHHCPKASAPPSTWSMRLSPSTSFSTGCLHSNATGGRHCIHAYGIQQVLHIFSQLLKIQQVLLIFSSYFICRPTDIIVHVNKLLCTGTLIYDGLTELLMHFCSPVLRNMSGNKKYLFIVS
jgi:hypothetical protein